jgi:hypothetical protein
MIPREALISQSVFDFMKTQLAANGYPPEKVKVREAFPTPTERSSPLTVTTVAIGFVFDDGGVPAELGSGLTRYVHTVEFWVFGTTPTYARNVAYVMRAFLLDDYVVPLKNYGVAGSPVIDQLPLEDERAVRVQQQVATDPRTWDLNVWTTTAKFEDYVTAGMELV